MELVSTKLCSVLGVSRVFDGSNFIHHVAQEYLMQAYQPQTGIQVPCVHGNDQSTVFGLRSLRDRTT